MEETIYPARSAVNAKASIFSGLGQAPLERTDVFLTLLCKSKLRVKRAWSIHAKPLHHFEQLPKFVLSSGAASLY